MSTRPFLFRDFTPVESARFDDSRPFSELVRSEKPFCEKLGVRMRNAAKPLNGRLQYDKRFNWCYVKPGNTPEKTDGLAFAKPLMN